VTVHMVGLIAVTLNRLARLKVSNLKNKFCLDSFLNFI
jgi:hypothetical protein